MTYSFIKPKLKPLFSVFTKLWLGFIFFIVSLMVAFDIFTIMKTSILSEQRASLKKLQHENVQKTHRVDLNTKKILAQKAVVEEIYALNEALKNEIRNNFNQVPDQITLSKVKMEKDSLILYGLTPSKDLYNFVLALPLRARYDTSDTVFYLNKKGWYRFISTNKLINKKSQ